MVKAVIIGTSGHFAYATQAIKRGAPCEIVAIAPGHDGELKRETVSVLGVPVYDDYKKMLNETQAHIAIINPQFHNISICIIEALKQNISVFCEKPIALSHQELSDVQAEASKSTARICAMMGMRYEAPFVALKKLIDSGAIGNVRLLHAQKSYRLKQRENFFKNRKTYGGTIPWVGSHPIDMIYWLSGRKKYMQVSAFHSILSNNNHGDLEATAAMLFEMEDEMIATVNIDYLRPDDASTHGDDRIRIMGDKGCAEVSGGKLFLNDSEIELGKNGDIFAGFVAELMGGPPCDITNEDSIYITHVCLLARDAADGQISIRMKDER